MDAYREHVDALNQTGAHIIGTVNMTVLVKACYADAFDLQGLPRAARGYRFQPGGHSDQRPELRRMRL